MRIALGAVFLLSSAMLLAQNQPPAQSADQLRDLAKQARKAGDLQTDAGYLCEAAGLDGKKYGKKCEKANEDAAKALLQFQADLNAGRTELEHKNYSGALRDLGKITFGPTKSEAQELMLRARIESGTLPPEQLSQVALTGASEAFSRGDFDRAEDLLKHVQSQTLQSAANKLESSIHAYRDAMKQGDELDRSGDYNGAAQRYHLAATIKPDGPGQPLERIRQALDAQAKADEKKAHQTASPSAPVQEAQVPAPKSNDAEKIKNWLTIARRDETGGDLKGALQAYDAALKLNGREAEALASRTRVLNKMKNDDQALEKNLVQGVAEFYAFQFSAANELIGKYLKDASGQHAGAAHFYLGASLLSQAILADPKNAANSDALRNQALEQFVVAKQLHYAPLQSAVSPKILAQWTQTANTQ
ncbi:MAG: hypothetical protein WBX22_16080 [Silvibacterium sp.]|jgi:hypothetical protein